MVAKSQIQRRSGINSLAYMGVDPVSPGQQIQQTRPPTTNDLDFNIGSVWIVSPGTYSIWMLVDKADFTATWLQMNGGGGGSGIQTITGDVGGAVGPDMVGNISLQGGSHYIFTGNPGSNLLTLSDDGTLAYTYTTDSGVATPSSNNLNIVGAGIISTSAVGDTVTITAAGSVPVSIGVDVGGPVTPIAGVLDVLGGNNIITSGAGNTITVDVTGTTDHAVQIGNATGSLDSIAIGADGQVLIGATGADPAFATLTSGDGSITFTVGPNSLDIKAAGAGPGVTTIDADSGSCAPAGGILNVFGGENITTSAAGNTLTAKVSGTTQYAPQMGSATGGLDDIGIMTTGELMIGVTGNAPNLARLLVGDNIAIDDTSSPGDITISLGGTTNHAVQIGNASNSLTSLVVGTNGQVLIGATGANPAFATLTSTGGSIAFTTGANSLNLEAVSGTPLNIHGNSGTASPSGASLNVLGSSNITTTASGNTITASLTGTTNHAVQIGNSSGSLQSIAVGTNGQVLIGATGANPAFATLTSTGGSIAFTTGANSLNLEAVSGTPLNIHTDSGTAVPSAGILNITGGHNITVTGSGNTVIPNVSGTVNHAPLIGNGTGSLSSIGPMTTGQLMIGITGSDPNLARLTAGTGISIDDTSSPGNITISSSGSGGGSLIQQVRTFTTARILNTGEYWGSVGAGGPNPNGAFSTPLLSEGTQIMSLTITPTSAASILLIEANCILNTDLPATRGCIYLIRDAGTQSIATSVFVPYPSLSASSLAQSVTLLYYVTAGTTSPTTFYLRMGETRYNYPTRYVSLNGVTTGIVNQWAGGTAVSTFTISEIAP